MTLAKHLPAILALLVLAACSSVQRQPPVPSGTSIAVLPVKNLSGVTLRVPEIWLGDAGEKVAGMNFEMIDLRLLAEAGLRARLSQQHPIEPGRHELHAAISRFEMNELRRTGHITLGLAVMLIDTQTHEVLAQSNAEQDCQLMDRPPAETGIVGEQRFIRKRLELFMEDLASKALLEIGL